MSGEEIARFNVLFEHLDGKLTALQEGVTVLIARADRTDERLDRIEGRFDRVEVRFDRLELKVDGLAERLERVEGRLINVERHVGLNGAGASKKSSRKPRKQ